MAKRMTVIECVFDSIFQEYAGQQRLRCILKMNHPKYGGSSGEYTISSQIKTIDFENKVCVTQNNIYKWD